MYVDEEVIEAHKSEEPMPFDQLEQKEATGFLLRIVGTLPPRQQEVLQLKFQNDLSTLRQRYAQDAGDFIPFKPKPNE